MTRNIDTDDESVTRSGIDTNEDGESLCPGCGEPFDSRLQEAGLVTYDHRTIMGTRTCEVLYCDDPLAPDSEEIEEAILDDQSARDSFRDVPMTTDGDDQ